MEWILANWDNVLIIVSGIITTASAIVKLTPTPKDDAILSKVVKFLEVIALNKPKK